MTVTSMEFDCVVTVIPRPHIALQSHDIYGHTSFRGSSISRSELSVHRKHIMFWDALRFEAAVQLVDDPGCLRLVDDPGCLRIHVCARINLHEAVEAHPPLDRNVSCARSRAPKIGATAVPNANIADPRIFCARWKDFGLEQEVHGMVMAVKSHASTWSFKKEAPGMSLVDAKVLMISSVTKSSCICVGARCLPPCGRCVVQHWKSLLPTNATNLTSSYYSCSQYCY